MNRIRLRSPVIQFLAALMAKRRNWSEAYEKCEDEGVCRVSGCNLSPTPAHLWHRGMGGGMDAEGIIPLCLSHHTSFDGHALDVLELCTLEEQLYTVRAAGSIERARRRLAPSEYRKT